LLTPEESKKSLELEDWKGKIPAGRI